MRVHGMSGFWNFGVDPRSDDTPGVRYAAAEPATGGHPPVKVKTYYFAMGRPGLDAFVFWSLDDIDEHLALEGLRKAYLKKRLRAGFEKTWGAALQRLGLDPSHVLHAFRQEESDVAIVLRAVSSNALLLLVVHWSMHLRSSANRMKAFALLQSFVAVYRRFAADAITIDADGASIQLSVLLGVVQWGDFILSPAWQALDRKLRKANPFANQDRVPLVDFLTGTMRREAWRPVCVQVAGAIATSFEKSFAWLEWPSEALQHTAVRFGKRKELRAHRGLGCALVGAATF